MEKACAGGLSRWKGHHAVVLPPNERNNFAIESGWLAPCVTRDLADVHVWYVGKLGEELSVMIVVPTIELSIEYDIKRNSWKCKMEKKI